MLGVILDRVYDRTPHLNKEPSEKGLLEADKVIHRLEMLGLEVCTKKRRVL